MPASVCDPVSSALRLSLSADNPQSSSLLDNRLYASAKTGLLTKIEFEESGDYQSNVLDGLKSKYVVIRPKKQILDTKLIKKEGIGFNQTSDGSKNTEDGLPKPKRVLFPLDKVKLGWQMSWSAGAGMQNVGNTCYLNSTLQALFHVPALANWLVSEDAEKCNQQEGCVICGMRACIMATQKSGGAPIKPWQVYSKLRLICRHLTPGRQEDAHEFLRYLVEAMEKCYLSQFVNSDKFGQYSKETTPLNQILGGYLRSTVRCLACQHLSTTYQHFQDLLLDIRKHSTLEEALDSFFSRERLEDLGYKCEACNKKVSATKQFFIERAPMVLCIAFKRFSLIGGKLSKHVQFRKKIALNKYMYNKNNNQILSYKLVSLVTHLGPSQNCGHYTAIGQAPNGNYYQFDDSCVRPLPLSAVLGTNAYIMFFEKDTDESHHPAPSTSVVYGPQLPNNILNRDKSPLKLTLFKQEDRKVNSTTTVHKPDIKPIILNSTLSRSEPSGSNSEPWVVKQNGEVEKVSKLVHNVDKIKEEPTDKKVGFILRPNTDERVKPKVKTESDVRTIVNNARIEMNLSTSKLVKPKSPLEKLEEQMNRSDLSNHTQKNGNGIPYSPNKQVTGNGNCSKVTAHAHSPNKPVTGNGSIYKSTGNGSSKLVPYDSESSGDERGDRTSDERRKEGFRKQKPSRCESPKGLVVTTTKGTGNAWTVSSEKPLMSPSMNGVSGVTNKQVKEEKEERKSDEISPNTSVSSMSPASDRSEPAAAVPPPPPPLPPPSIETQRHLQVYSHRGYGAPVDSWSGSHSQMSRQVFEERRDERKRAHSATDEMDQGRNKKVKRFHYNHRFNNNYGRDYYNPFQDKQNKPQQWSGNCKYRGDRRPHNSHHFNKHNKYKRFNNNRYNNNNHHYRHH